MVVGLPAFAIAVVAFVASLSEAPGPPASPVPNAAAVPFATATPAMTQSRATTTPSRQPAATSDPNAAAGVGVGTARDAPISADPERLTGYGWPLRKGRITGFFAPRPEGFLVISGKRVHEGLDIASFCGDKVRAAHSGKVVAASWKAASQMGFGGSLGPFFTRVDRLGLARTLSISVVVDDGNGYRSVYSHLAEALVRPGQEVVAGDRIGLEGATGNATGCHLHYELIRMDGAWMRVAADYVNRDRYPDRARARIDPLRVLSLDDPDAPRLVPGIEPPP